MKTRTSNGGYAMVMTLTFVGITLIAVASLVSWASSNAKVTGRNNQYVASQYAAEGAAEMVLAKMMADWQSQCMTNANQYVALVPTNYTSSWPISYRFSNPFSGSNDQTSVTIGATATNLSPLPPPYTGLQAFSEQCDIYATATPSSQLYNVPATIHETFLAASIPIFQFLIFYNIDLEIAAGQTLSASGPVFSNKGLWSASTYVTFNSTVWAVEQAYNQVSNPFANYTNGTGPANYTMALQPVSGVNSLNLPVAGINNTNNSPTNIEALLRWPPSAYGLGTTAAYSTNGQIYFANEADLIISNAFYSTNMECAFTTNVVCPDGTNDLVIYYQDSISSPTLTRLTNDFYIIAVTLSNIASPHAMGTNYFFTNYVANGRYIAFTTNGVTTNLIAVTNFVAGTNGIAIMTNNVPGTMTNVIRTSLQYAGYSFITNELFYDWREGWSNSSPARPKVVQAVQFDVGRFIAWLHNTNYITGTANLNGGQAFNTLSTSHKGHPIDGIYIYTDVVFNKTNLPAVRVANGAQLPDSYGLTIATQFPLYVLGDYNVTDGSGTSDAGKNVTAHTRPAGLMCDAISYLSSSFADTNSVKPSSSLTNTINAAVMAGIVESDLNIHASDDSTYSGGVENFWRALESWGATHHFYYNGSIVVMFPSQYATNRWRQTGNYYDAPYRNWAFDTNFTLQAHLPPMTPQVKSFVRSDWVGHQ